MDPNAVVHRIGVLLGTDPGLRAFDPEVIACVAREATLAILDAVAQPDATRDPAAAIAARLTDAPELDGVAPEVIGVVLRRALAVVGDVLESA